MGICHVFCAGDCGELLLSPGPGDWVLGADGGVRHLQKLGLKASEILGDFDSLGSVPPGATVFPVEKDDTDSLLAARRGLALGYRKFLFYGALDGPRLDHTLANFQMLAFLSKNGATAYLVGKRYLATVIQNEAVTFPAAATGILSLFCMGPDARGVTLQNLKYPLKDHVLTCSFPLGVSNAFLGAPARVEVRQGMLLALWDRNVGLPHRKEEFL